MRATSLCSRSAMGPRLLGTVQRGKTNFGVAGGRSMQTPPLAQSITKRTFFFGSKSGSSGGGQQQQQQQQNYRNFFKNRQYFHNSRPSDIGLQWTATLSDPKEVEPPAEQGLPSRSEQVRRLQGRSQDDSQNVEEYDILVVGGGATGAGVALDAVTRGYKVACIERGDFASETSSRSTKLLWAGIKYMGTAFAYALKLENYQKHGVGPVFRHFWSEMKMVYNCHVERHYMTTVNRHLCDWVAIACPMTKWIAVDDQGRYPLNQQLFAVFPIVAPVVMKFYDALSGFSCPPSYILTAKKAKETFPQLREERPGYGPLKYCSVFYEAKHNDARTNLAIALTAAQKGAHICNYVEAIDLITADHDSKVVVGARVRDRLTGDEWDVRAKKVVLAGGPFTDSLRKMEHGASVGEKQENTEAFSPAVRGGAGSHIVLPGNYLPKNIGVLDMQTSDGRFMFILPWLGHTLVGTTDSPSPAQTLPQPPEEEIDWLLREAQTYLKKDESMTWSRDQVLSAWRGWRPLAMDPHAEPGGHISRDHVISYNPDSGIFFIAGGKWTTWREMAYDIVDRVAAQLEGPGKKVPACVTKSLVLWGGEKGYSDNLKQELLAKYPDMDTDVAEHLVKTYAGHVWDLCAAPETAASKKQVPFYQRRLVPDYPYIEAEIPFACQEYACTIEDILSRRTRLAFLNRDAALRALPKVADVLADTLGWTSKVKKVQVEAAKHYIESFGGPKPNATPPHHID